MDAADSDPLRQIDPHRRRRSRERMGEIGLRTEEDDHEQADPDQKDDHPDGARGGRGHGGVGIRSEVPAWWQQRRSLGFRRALG